ncbi:MAG: 7-cyano-7-deazaguanine synthase, partial [Candidatus Thermoplasmatota archaeon]|nr:7-cyano-7-deazaguanine synthase [Candidatus Thermoplasmatota archaeon]
MSKKAVVLLSGGLDSATVCGIASTAGYKLLAITFSYGQRHKKELECAKALAQHYGVREHLITEIDLGKVGGSSLTDMLMQVPANRGNSPEIPSTYVPARNTIFLSYALAVAEVAEADEIFIGLNAIDYSG